MKHRIMKDNLARTSAEQFNAKKAAATLEEQHKEQREHKNQAVAPVTTVTTAANNQVGTNNAVTPQTLTYCSPYRLVFFLLLFYYCFKFSILFVQRFEYKQRTTKLFIMSLLRMPGHCCSFVLFHLWCGLFRRHCKLLFLHFIVVISSKFWFFNQYEMN